MIRKPATFILCTLILLSAFSLNAAAKTWTVGSTQDFAAALYDCKPGDTIRLKAGTYYSGTPYSLTGKNNITIIGIGKVQLLTPDYFAGSDYSSVLEITGCENLTIRNIQGCHKRTAAKQKMYWGNACSGPVLKLSRCSNVQILNCELNGCGAFGIEANNVNGLKVRGCHIHSNTFVALFLKNCTGLEIKANRIRNNYYICRKEHYSIIMKNNKVSGNEKKTYDY